MLCDSDIIKKVDQSTFEQERAVKGDNYVWKRTLNYLKIRIRLVSKNTHIQVHELSSKRRVSPLPNDFIHAQPNISYRIIAEADHTSTVTKLFFPEKTKLADEFLARRFAGKLNFSLESSEHQKSDLEGLIKNSYLGYTRYEGGEQGLWIDLSLPSDLLSHIASSPSGSELDLGLLVSSYTCVENDFFCNWQPSNQFLLESGSLALLTDICSTHGHMTHI